MRSINLIFIRWGCFMSRIAILPARSGSKGLIDKNIKDLNGMPLMAYSIRCAIESNMFDKVFVSTDSQQYADIAIKYGADASFLRSKENSDDNSSSWDVVREVINKLEADGERYNEIMLLQVTSPLRTADDIIASINLYYEKNADSVVSVTECEHSPLWCGTLPDDLNMDNFIDEKYQDVPRQKLPKYYRYNGAIYLIKRTELDKRELFKEKCFAYVMPKDRSIDIDGYVDFVVAEALIISES